MVAAASVLAASVIGGVISDVVLERRGRRAVESEYGPIDVRLTQSGTPDPSRDLGHLEDLIRHTTLEDTDGLITLMTSDATLRPAGRAGTEVVTGCVADVDFAAVRHFGPDRRIGGMAEAGSGPRPGEVVLNSDTADRLGAATGDSVDVTVADTTDTLVVVDVLEPVGVAGYCRAFVPPGHLLGVHAGTSEQATPLRGELLLSRTGGVVDAAAGTSALVADVRRLLAEAEVPGTTVDAPKAGRLGETDDTRSRRARAFTAVGAAAAVATVLLALRLMWLARHRRRDGGLDG